MASMAVFFSFSSVSAMALLGVAIMIGLSFLMTSLGGMCGLCVAYFLLEEMRCDQAVVVTLSLSV